MGVKNTWHTGSYRVRDKDQIIRGRTEIPSDHGPRTEISFRDFGRGDHNHADQIICDWSPLHVHAKRYSSEAYNCTVPERT